MTARAGLTVVGQVAGAFIGGPIGAAIGGAIGGMVGGAIDGPQRSTQALLDDLGALKFDYGSSWPRLYGTYRVKVTPIWSSEKRPVPHDEEVNSKGGPDQINRTFTYEQDWLCWAPLNATGWARIWINGKLRASRLSDADSETIEASAAQPAWADVTFFDGAADQLPWAVYEAAVGTANACAYRHRPTIAFSSLDLGNGGQPPLIEVEFASAGTSASVGFLEDFETSWPDEWTITTGAAPIGLNIGGPWGNYLTSSSRDPIGGSASTVLRDTGIDVAGTVTSISFKFRFEGPLDIATEWFDWCGQGPVIAVYGAPSGDLIFAFCMSQTNYYDPFQQALIKFNDESAAWESLGVQLPLNVWCDCTLELASSGSCRVTITNVGTSSVITTQSFALGSPVWTPNAIKIHNDFKPTWSGNLPGGSFDQIQFGVPADLITPETVMLSEIVQAEETLAWSGEAGALTAADIDVTELASTPVRGFLTTSSPRESVAQLMDVFYFGVTCSDKLYHRLRGAASIGSVAADDTGAGVGSAGEIFAGLERGNDLEQAIQVAVTGPNVLTDYEPGTEISDRLVGESVELRRYTTAVVLTPAERKGRADTMVLDGRVASHTGQVALDDRHAEKEPFDVWTQFDDEGNSYRVRADRETYADGVRTFDVVLDDATVLSTSGITAETDSRALTVRSAPDTTFVLLDIPLLKDADDGPGFYVAVKAGNARWTGCAVYGSADDLTYTQLGSLAVQTEIGTCTTALGDWAAGTVFDETNSVTVDIGEQTLASWSRADILAGTATGYVIGNELIYAMNATLVSAGVYTLTGLLRGRRGTEWAMTGHAASERFVALRANGSGLLNVALTNADIGVSRYYKAVTSGRALSSVTAQAFTCQSVRQKPFSPVDLRALVGPKSSTITWKRRTRYLPRFTGDGGINVPLGEAAEKYDVEIYDASDVLTMSFTVDTPYVTIDSMSPSFSLSWAAQFLQKISGNIVGTTDQYPSQNETAALYVYDAAGALLGGQYIGSDVQNMIYANGDLYFAAFYVNHPSHVYRLEPANWMLQGTIADAAAATYTSIGPGDAQGLAYDGTDIWTGDFYFGNLRRLDRTTLAVLDTYTFAYPGFMIYESGSLWICDRVNDEIVEWNVTSGTEVRRIACTRFPMTVRVVGSLLIVVGADAFVIYDAATGNQITSLAGAVIAYPGRQNVVVTPSFIYVADCAVHHLVKFDVTTGLEVSRTYVENIYAVVGSDGETVYVAIHTGTFDGQLPGNPNPTNYNELTTVAYVPTTDLTGSRVVVYQRSGTVGRGYSGSMTI